MLKLKKFAVLLLILVYTLVSGCASVPKNAREPAPVPGTEETVVVIDGLSGVGKGAAIGAAGGGAGAALPTLFVGGLACAATGFLAGVCFAGLLTATGVAGAVGAAGGALYGASIAENPEDFEAKRSLLTEALGALDANQRLTSMIDQLRDDQAGTPQPNFPRVTDLGWTLHCRLTQLATVGAGQDVPYALKGSARLEVVTGEGAEPVFFRDYQAMSPQKLQTVEWQADDAEPLRSALEDLLETLAADMLRDLLPLERSRYTSADYAGGKKVFLPGGGLMIKAEARQQDDYRIGEDILVEMKNGNSYKIRVLNSTDNFVNGTLQEYGQRQANIILIRNEISMITLLK